MFTFGSATELDITLQVGEATVLAVGKVVTSHPTVGNGIQFLRMLPEDAEELDCFLQAVESEEKKQLEE